MIRRRYNVAPPPNQEPYIAPTPSRRPLQHQPSPASRPLPSSSAYISSSSSSSSSSDSALPLVDTFLLNADHALKGLLDATSYPRFHRQIKQDPLLTRDILLSLLINLPLLVLILFLSHILIPLTKSKPSRLAPASSPSALSRLFQSPQLWHLIGISAVVLANTARQSRIGARSAGRTSISGGGESALATRVILIDYLLVTTILRIIPWVGGSLAFLYSAYSSAFYSFAYVWSSRTVKEQIRFVQTRFCYFFGFGFPLSFLTSLPFVPPLLSSTLFALFFPIFVVLASRATPYPIDASELPLSAEDGISGRRDAEESAGSSDREKWNPLWPKRLPVLAVGEWLAELYQAFVATRR